MCDGKKILALLKDRKKESIINHQERERRTEGEKKGDKKS